METIPDDVLDHDVEGWRLGEGPLRAQIGRRKTLLVLLRHFG